MIINSFDCDGVITLGIYPGKDDIIITGRSFEETNVTLEMLRLKGIFNDVYFNPLPFNSKTRKSSGEHKANVIFDLFKKGVIINIHIDDDPIQLTEINSMIMKNSLPTKTIFVDHGGLEELENVRRDKFGKPIHV